MQKSKIKIVSNRLNQIKRNTEKGKWNPQEEKDRLRLYQTLQNKNQILLIFIIFGILLDKLITCDKNEWRRCWTFLSNIVWMHQKCCLGKINKKWESTNNNSNILKRKWWDATHEEKEITTKEKEKLHAIVVAAACNRCGLNNLLVINLLMYTVHLWVILFVDNLILSMLG